MNHTIFLIYKHTSNTNLSIVSLGYTMKKSYLTPEMTSISTSIPVSAVTARATASISSSDNVMITKIKNATEGLLSTCFNHLYNIVLPGPRGKENAHQCQ
jgi:hypothetical protein